MKSPKSISKLLGGVGKLALLFVFGFLVVSILPQSAKAAMGGINTPKMYESVSTADSHSIANNTQDDLQCSATDSSAIHCELKIGSVSHTCGLGNKVGGDATCRAHNYFYDPVISSRAGFDVFVAEMDSDRTFAENAKDFGYIVFPDAKSGDYANFVISTKYTDGAWGLGLNDEMAGDDTTVFTKAAPAGFCSILLNAGGPKTCKIGGQNKPNDPNARNGKTVTAAEQGKYKSNASKGTKQKADEDCGGSALNFIICPTKKMLDDAVSWVMQKITDELVIHTANFTTDPSAQGLKDTFNNKILVLANSLFVLIFLVIIFGNSLGLDSYTVKKTLPRLVAAVVLAQFSYYLAGAMMEVGNVLGQAINTTIFGNDPLSLSAIGLSGGGGSAVGNVAGVLIEIIFVIISLVGALIGFFVLAIRQIILIGLLLTGPIALAAWVLPGTEKVFKLWWSNLLKLSLMFPMIVGILGGSIYLSKIILANGTGNFAVQIGAQALPIIALFYLPKTFKWTGSMMEKSGGAVAGFGTKQAKKQTVGRAKDDFNKEGGTKDKLAAAGFTPTFGGRKRLEKMGAAEDRVQKAAETGSNRAARIINAMPGGKETGTAEEQAQFNAKQAAVRSTMRTLHTPEAQAKFAAGLAKAGDRSSVGVAREIMGDSWAAGVAANSDAYDGMADMKKTTKEWNAPATATSAAGKEKFYSGLTAESFTKGSKDSQEAWTADGAYKHMAPRQLQLLGDQGVRSKMSTGAYDALKLHRASVDAKVTAGTASQLERDQATALTWVN